MGAVTSIAFAPQVPWPALATLGIVATAFAAFNVVGGFLVTDRMLGMFKQKDRS